MIVTSLFESIDDMMCETQVSRAQPSYVQNLTNFEGDPTTSASAFVRHYLFAHGVARRAAHTIGRSATVVVFLRRRFGIQKLPVYACPTRDEAARRLLSASDEELHLWGFAMNQYWKMTHAIPSRETDPEKFLIISSAIG